MQEQALLHSLAATRDLARQHDGEVWRRLEARVDGLVDRSLTLESDQHEDGELRIDRDVLDDGRADEVMAALLPLGESPDESRAALALERLDALDGGAGRDDGPTPPERDPALVDEGW